VAPEDSEEGDHFLRLKEKIDTDNSIKGIITGQEEGRLEEVILLKPLMRRLENRLIEEEGIIEEEEHTPTETMRVFLNTRVEVESHTEEEENRGVSLKMKEHMMNLNN
jgi:hypothetical protein